MSDGPYKSLPMSRGWKKAAESADCAAAPLADVVDAVTHAARVDWGKQINRGLIERIKKILRQNSFFEEVQTTELEKLRRFTNGHVLRSALLDFAVLAIDEGKTGVSVLEEATANTLLDLCGRSSRQIEEHGLRETNMRGVTPVRQRIEEAVQQIPFSGLARTLLDPKTKTNTRIKKHDGLDDGVPL